LRSSDSGKLSTPRVCLETYGKRTFAFAGPTIWNALPVDLRNNQTLESFKTDLKTHLFRKYLLG
ncbi:unnamed protein product, partial [Lymnaea stagnalis]